MTAKPVCPSCGNTLTTVLDLLTVVVERCLKCRGKS